MVCDTVKDLGKSMLFFDNLQLIHTGLDSLKVEFCLEGKMIEIGF